MLVRWPRLRRAPLHAGCLATSDVTSVHPLTADIPLQCNFCRHGPNGGKVHRNKIYIGKAAAQK